MSGTILLTGATGYVGGRLLPRLEMSGRPVRCLARRPEFLAPRVGPNTEIVCGDVLVEETLAEAMRGVETAYYMVHAMGNSGNDFEEEDLRGATNFGRAARTAGVRQIVYLGGLGDDSAELSPHLRSRHEVGRALRASGVPVIEFRAAIVIGSGSVSFEMFRSLVERLPIMVTPRWVDVASQPIAIEDLLAYLEAVLEMDERDRIYQIGSNERVSYGDLMREYARQRQLRRVMIPVPVLTPRLSSLWLGLVTPLYARVGKILVESICHETVVRDDQAHRDFDIEPMGVGEAISRALANEDAEFAATRWSDAISSGGTDPGVFASFGGVRRGQRLIDSRQCEVSVDAASAFEPIRRIGGSTGWYAYDWLWKLRGALDLLMGGVGVRRGRADTQHLRVGDTVDWWRVETYEPDQLVRMRAEMKVPGRAWLEFEVLPTQKGCTIRQTAVFDPSGMLGLLYWYGVYPLHAAVFRGMLTGIAEAAERTARD